MRRTHSQQTQRFGVGGRLLLAFFAISGFAILAAAAAMYAFLANTEVLDRITERRVPAALDALELSRQAERIVAAAPALLTVTTDQQQEEIFARIGAEIERLFMRLATLEKVEGKGTQASGAQNSLARWVEELRTNLTALDEVVAERLKVGQRKKELIDELLVTHTAAQRLLSPWILTLTAQMARAQKRINELTLGEQSRAEASVEMKQADSMLQAVQQALLETSVIDETLLHVASAARLDRLKVLAFRLERSLGNVRRLLPTFDPKLRPLLEARLDEFAQFVSGPRGIPQTQEREITLLDRAERLLAQNDTLTQQLTPALDELVENARQDIANAKTEARQVQSLSTAILVAVVVLAVGSSILIVWLYVGRNLVARLTALSDSMLAIAGGNLESSIPMGGNDEIRQMADALGVFRDTAVEVKKSNLREIREARNRLTEAIESISEGFSLYDADDRLVVFNNRYREIMYPDVVSRIEPGMSFEAITRKGAELGLVADARGRTEEWVAERLARHREPSGPHLQRRGEDRWVQISERKTESGGTVAVYSDITEIKRAEQALRESEERYALAMKGANEGLWDWQRSANEVHVSPRFAELTGLELNADKIPVAAWEARIHPDDLQAYRDAVRAHWCRETPFYEAEYRVRGADEGYRWVRDRGLGLRDERGKVYRMAGSMGDISELKSREQELRAAKEEAERALEELKLTQRSLIQSEKMASLGQLTAGIAHEIKNPLNFINNFAKTSGELLDELAAALDGIGGTPGAARLDEVAELIETLKEDMATICGHGERADRIVKGMLLHSRGEAGVAQITDLNALIAESLNLAYHGQRASSPGFNVTMKQELDPAVGKFEVVSQEIMRVLVNLIANAFYAIQRRQESEADGYEPTVWVSSRVVAENRVEVRLRDNGTGIPADVRERLFTPFFTTKPAGEGTGLGLSISRDIIVEQHGGSIRVDSEAGAFTEFVITLPRTQHGRQSRNREQ